MAIVSTSISFTPTTANSGAVTGELSLQGTLTTHIEYIFPSLNWGLGKFAYMS